MLIDTELLPRYVHPARLVPRTERDLPDGQECLEGLESLLDFPLISYYST